MNKDILTKVVLPLACVLWLLGVFFLGWKTILWTIVGLAIGGITKQLRENEIR